MKNAKNGFDRNYNFDVTSNFGCLSTKRNLRADGLSLLPSALRPRLVGGGEGGSKSEIKSKSEIGGIFIYLHFRISELSVVVLCSFVFSFIIQNSYVSNTSAVSLTLTVPSAPLSVNLNPNTDNGFAKSTDGNISVSTAANWGFQLSVQAKDSNALKNGSNSLTSITTSIDEATFKSGADYVNKWGFKPSKLNSAANTNFVAGPTTSPTIIEKTSGNSSSPTQYTVAIGAKANGTLATGTYSNNFTFTAVANTVSYTINYNLESGSWTGTSPQSGSTTDKTVNISNISPTRANYSFEGWCSTTVTDNSGSNPTCSGTKYSAGGSYTLSNGTNTVNLYAMWKSTHTDLGDLGTMQNFSCSKISKTEDYGTVTDSRDNNRYKVAKLKDGKCWMIENLRIVGRSISSSNSDMTSGSFSVPSSNLSTFNLGSTGYQAQYVNYSAAYVDSTYGGYYTWYTATAGTGSSSITSSDVNATSSICPKGWKLPTGGSSSEFNDLVTAYGGNNSTGSAALRATPVPGFTYAGYVYYYDGSLSSQGSYGYYCSSTSVGSTYAYYLGLSSSDANPARFNWRVYGVSVRCVAR